MKNHGRLNFLISAILACLCLAGVGNEAFATIPMIKVRVGKSLHQTTISGVDLKSVYLEKHQKQYNGRKALNFQCRALQIESLVKNTQGPVLLATVSSPSGFINWEKDRFRGRMDIVTFAGEKSCDVVNNLSLEDYISTLLGKEMNSQWPIEALKAQAVAARSYALYKIERNDIAERLGSKNYYDLENSEKHQVNGSFSDETYETMMATRDTRGEILVGPSGQLTPIFFHSKCGGRTFTPDQVWNEKVEGYEGVKCPYCAKYGAKDWTYEMHEVEFARLVFEALKQYAEGNKIPKNRRIRKDDLVEIVPDRSSQFLIRAYINGELYMIKKGNFRKYLGRAVLASNNFKIIKKGEKIIFTGIGLGHGVGMCQFGALEMAKRGFNYRQILSFYFPGHKLKKLY